MHFVRYHFHFLARVPAAPLVCPGSKANIPNFPFAVIMPRAPKGSVSAGDPPPGKTPPESPGSRMERHISNQLERAVNVFAQQQNHLQLQLAQANERQRLSEAQRSHDAVKSAARIAERSIARVSTPATQEGLKEVATSLEMAATRSSENVTLLSAKVSAARQQQQIADVHPILEEVQAALIDVSSKIGELPARPPARDHHPRVFSPAAPAPPPHHAVSRSRSTCSHCPAACAGSVAPPPLLLLAL